MTARKLCLYSPIVIWLLCLSLTGCVSGPRGLFGASDSDKDDADKESIVRTSFLSVIGKSDEDKNAKPDDRPGRVRINVLGDPNRDLARQTATRQETKQPESKSSLLEDISNERKPSIAANDAKRPTAKTEIEEVAFRRGAELESQDSEVRPIPDTGEAAPFRRIPGDSPAPSITDPFQASASPADAPTADNTQSPTPATEPKENRFVPEFEEDFANLRDKHENQATETNGSNVPFARIPDDAGAPAETPFAPKTAPVEQRPAPETPQNNMIAMRIQSLVDRARDELATGKISAAYRTARSAARMASTSGLTFSAGSHPNDLVDEIRRQMRASAAVSSAPENRGPVQLQKPVLADDGSGMEIVPLGNDYVPQGRATFAPPQQSDRSRQYLGLPRSSRNERRLELLRQRLQREIQLRGSAIPHDNMIVDSQHVPSVLEGKPVNLPTNERQRLQRANAGKLLAAIRRPEPPSEPTSHLHENVQTADYPESAGPSSVELAGFDKENAPAPPELQSTPAEFVADPFANAKSLAGSELEDDIALDNDPAGAPQQAPAAPEESSDVWFWLVVSLVLGAVGYSLRQRLRKQIA